MDATDHGLLDMPNREPSTAAQQRAVRGWNEETWTRTVSAAVTVIDTAAVRQAAAQGNDVASPSAWEPEPSQARPVLEDLAWLIFTTDALDGLRRLGAFSVRSAGCEILEERVDQGVATWTVTIVLKDVDALRRLATQAHPEDAALIADSLEVAWQHAAEPFAPLRAIRGIVWRPNRVDVEGPVARVAWNG